LVTLVEEHTGGNPQGPEKWVRRSLRNLSRDLEDLGHAVSPATVGRLLDDEDYSPKANRKSLTGPRHPDRDRQFAYIAQQKAAFLAAGLPVVSMDSKKRELIGNFKNAGRSWCRQAQPVNAYDFRDQARGIAIPYGLYVVNLNRGYVEVGTSGNTAAFAVDVLGHWWANEGRSLFPAAAQLLLFADGGGSNGCRPRLWKLRLQEGVADRFGLTVTVCHYPTGASKYNPVERHLFSRITSNWAGKPLESYPVLLAYVRGTKTETGLRVRARLNRQTYPTKVKVSGEQMASLHLERHKICPRWNYTIKPRSDSD
jgi:hypothetical protein